MGSEVLLAEDGVFMGNLLISQMRRLGQREFSDLVKVNITNKW